MLFPTLLYKSLPSLPSRKKENDFTVLETKCKVSQVSQVSLVLDIEKPRKVVRLTGFEWGFRGWSGR